MNLRLFIAITPPAALLSGIAGVQAEAMTNFSSRAFRWQSPDKWHITLQFLGNIGAELVEDLTSRLRAVPARSSFPLTLGAPGVFPSLRRPRVLWLGFDGDFSSLRELRSDIVHATGAMGAPDESRAFTPHLTLARIAEPLHSSSRRALTDWVESMPPRRFSWEVKDFELWQSTFKPGGSVYAQLARFSLGGGLEAECSS